MNKDLDFKNLKEKITKYFLDIMKDIDLKQYSVIGAKKIFLFKWMINKFEIISYSRGYNKEKHWLETNASEELLKKDISNNLPLMKYEHGNGLYFKYKNLIFSLTRADLTSDNDIHLYLYDKNLSQDDKDIKMFFLDKFFNDDLEYSSEELLNITKIFMEKIDELILKREIEIKKNEIKKEKNEKTKENIEKLILGGF